MFAVLQLAIYVAFAIFAIVVGIEAVVLLLLKWGSFARSFIASLLMNALSLATWIAAATLYVYTVSRLFHGRDLVLPFGAILGPVVLWSSAWAITVLAEGALLQAVRPRGELLRRSWAAAVVANTVSYALLLLIGILAV